MGNNESNPVRNLDKRTARREYKDYFLSGIRQFNHSVLIENDVVTNGRRIASNNYPAHGKSISGKTANIKVCVRKRPFFSKEDKAGEFDVITCIDSKQIVTHDCRMEADMKSMYINRNRFIFDYVFNDKCSNIDVYNETTSHLVRDTIENASYNTAMVYGQTGSGKTFTMSSIYENTADEIFQIINNNELYNDMSVSISFIEIAGESVHDILNNFMPCQLLSAVDGSVHAFPTVEPVVKNKQQLLAIVAHGIRVRSTAETGVHDSSSRSHAVLRIFFNSGSNHSLDREGCLTLVDLAGTEHKIDSMYHSKDRRNETSKINSSLSALKFCLNAISTYNNSSSDSSTAADANADNGKSSNDISHHFRKSKLTMVLKSSLLEPTANTVIIATVSPASKDTDHSLNTLRHATLMGGCSLANEEKSVKKSCEPAEKRFITGGIITKHPIGQLNISEITRRNQQQLKNRGGVVDLKTDNGNELKGEAAVDLTEKEKDAIRMQKERRSLKSMESEHRLVLLQSRQLLGQNELQIRRQRRQKPQVLSVASPMNNDSGNSILVTIKEDIIITNFDIKAFNKLHAQCMSSVDSSGESKEFAIRQIISLLKGKGFPKNKIEKLFYMSKQNGGTGFLIPIIKEAKEESSSGSNSNGDRGAPMRVSFKEFAEKNNSAQKTNNHSGKENINEETFTAIEAVSDNDLKLFKRMHSSIFYNQEESSPEILNRQLISLLTLKGFSKKKIEQLFMMHNVPNPKLTLAPDKGENGSNECGIGSSIIINNHANSSNSSTNSNSSNNNAFSQYENEIAMKNQRRQSAREKALEKEAERINFLKEKLRKKEKRGNIIGINTSDLDTSNTYESNHNFVSNEIELNILLDELQNTTKNSTVKEKNTSAAKVFALKKKISMLRANITKAQKYSKDNTSNEYSDSDPNLSPPPPNKFAARYTLTNGQNVVPQSAPPTARAIDYNPISAIQTNQNHALLSYYNSNYSNHYDCTNATEAIKNAHVQRSNRGRNSIGAASAPFGNDYSYFDEKNTSGQTNFN